MIVLPPELLTAVLEGRAVLFLGAGASLGAINAKNQTMPDAKQLAAMLVKEFLGSDYEGLDLRSAYDLSCSQRDVRAIQRFVFETLSPFQPAPFHLLIPSFAWAGLATTNYDLIIERAYTQAPSSLQNLIPNIKDGDNATDQLNSRAVLYVKLHGCITRHQEVAPPLIASTEQLIAFREGRNGQFDTFLEWAKTKTMIFCGYAFMDSNLRILFDEIIKDGDNRPRHFIISKNLKDAVIGYWRDRRVIAIDGTFEGFLETLDQGINSNQRTLASVAVGSLNQTTFTRFITTAGSQESANLKTYLSSLIEHVGPGIDPLPDDAARFYRGFDLDWYPIAEQLDVRQPIVDDLLREHVLAASSNAGCSLTVIKGHAGSGKSVVLKRVCYEAATKHDRLCLFVSRQHLIQVDEFEEIFRLSNLPVFLFIDNVAEHRSRLQALFVKARGLKASLHVIATETFNTWNTLCDDLEPFVSEVLEMRYLSEANIKVLISKLEKHKSLGYLAGLPADKRVYELQHVHGRQILVALLEATHGVPLMDIIATEYNSIYPPEAKLIYLDICSLHRFGPPVRAGLISRIHNISFEDFEEKFFKPLEAIVVLGKDPRSGDYVYEARHSFIAHTVYERIVTTQAERFDNLVRVIIKLNPGFSYDLEVIAKIIKAEALQNALSDHAKIRQVYDVAMSAIGERAVILHQRGVFEMHVAVNFGALDVAEDLLTRAGTLEPYNRSIKHSLSEVDLKRSRITQDRQLRAIWRRKAVERATALIAKGSSPYPHHTLLKAAIDAVKDALEEAEDGHSDALTQKLGESIAHAEAVLKRGRQSFPAEATLLSGEGELSKVLSQAVRSEGAFEKAFAANPRSTLIARRLSRIKRSKLAHEEAQAVLRKCLEFNPSAQDIHFDFAMSLLESAPDADQSQGAAILYHLRRAFSPGDKNIQAQFWYARQLCISGHYADARELFRNLSEASVPYREKGEVRGQLLDSTGSPQELVGAISFLQNSFGFIQHDPLNLRAWFPIREIEPELADYLAVGSILRFELGFSLKGPVASKLIF